MKSLSDAFLILSNISFDERYRIPGCSNVPRIVYVLPDDVWPYAKIVPFIPSSTSLIIGSPMALYTSSDVCFSSNTWSNNYYLYNDIIPTG